MVIRAAATALLIGLLGCAAAASSPTSAPPRATVPPAIAPPPPPEGHIYFLGEVWPVQNARPARDAAGAIRVVVHDGNGHTAWLALSERGVETVWEVRGAFATSAEDEPDAARRRQRGLRNEFSTSVARVAPDGALWIAGTNSAWDLRFRLARVSPRGDVLATIVQRQRGEAYLTDIAFGSGGDVYATAMFGGTLALDGVPALKAGYLDGLLVRIDGDRPSWARAFPSGNGGADHVWLDERDGLRITGSFRKALRLPSGRVDLDPGRPRMTDGKSLDSSGFLAAVSRDGRIGEARPIAMGAPVRLADGSVLVAPWTSWSTTLGYDARGAERWRLETGTTGAWVDDERARDSAWRIVDGDVDLYRGRQRVRLEELASAGPTGRRISLTTRAHTIYAIRQPWRAAAGTLVVGGVMRRAGWDATHEPVAFVAVLAAGPAADVDLDRLVQVGAPPASRCRDPLAAPDVSRDLEAGLGALRRRLFETCGADSGFQVLAQVAADGAATVREVRINSPGPSPAASACIRRVLAEGLRVCPTASQSPVLAWATMPHAGPGGR